jgi:hypothetical protein
MSNPIIELPINLKLDEKYFPANAVNDQAQITITLPNTLTNGIYTLPSHISNGVLTNNGTGILIWEPLSAIAIDKIEVDNALTDGTFKIIQNGTGASSIRYTAGSLNYSIGIDQNTSNFKISKSTNLGTNDIFVFGSDENLVLSKSDAGLSALLTLNQLGAGDISLNFKNSTTNYTIGIDSSANVFKISNNSELGTNDMLIINSTNVQIGPNTNLITVESYQTTIGPSSNILIIPTQTTIGPSSMITVTSANVTLGPSSALQTSSTHIDIAKNLILPTTATDGSAGVFQIGDCYFANLNSTKNLFIGQQTNYYTLSGSYNICIGYSTNSALTTGAENTFIGADAGEWTDTGSYNAFYGSSAGEANVSGTYNTYIGTNAGSSAESGNYNTCIGFEAGNYLTTESRCTYIGGISGLYAEGNDNTCIGYASGYYLGTSGNTMIGAYSGINTYLGSQNTFVGTSSGYTNFGGYSNDYFGYETGYTNAAGWGNVAFGSKALRAQNGGNNNTVIGYHSMITSTNIDNNVCIGYNCAQGMKGSDNVVIGHYALGSPNNTATNCVVIGGSISIAAATINNRVCIGYNSTCSVDSGFVLGDATTMVGIRNNSPSQPLDVSGNAQFTGQVILVPQTVPSPAILGAIYFDTTAKKLKVCTDAGIPTWETVSST